MSSLVSLSTMRTQAISLSDQTNSGFVSTTEWNAFINAEASDLYRKLCISDPDRFIVRFPSPYLIPLGSAWLSYTTASSSTAFVVGNVITGGTSGATATVSSAPDQACGRTAAGTIYVANASGTFTNGETITCAGGGTATVTRPENALTVVQPSGGQFYALPGDFWLLNRVDYIQSGSQPLVFQTILAVNQMEEDAYQFTTCSFYGQGIRYRLQGNLLMFVPAPPINGTIQILYTPAYRTLVNDSDTIDDIAGWADTIILGAAIRALSKENNFAHASVLADLKRMQDEEFKRISQATRDKSTPATTISMRNKASGRGGGYRNW